MAAIPHLGRRGERPVFFDGPLPQGRLERIMQIPGVQGRAGGICCTWDIAWAVAALLGRPEPINPLHDLDSDEAQDALANMPGLDRYFDLKGYWKRDLGMEPRGYQKEAAHFLALRHYAIAADPMRCLPGGVLIDVRLLEGGEPDTPRKMELHDIAGLVESGARVQARSLSKSSGLFKWNDIEAAHHVGEKHVFQLRTQRHQLDCSRDHRFLARWRGTDEIEWTTYLPFSEISLGSRIAVYVPGKRAPRWERVTGLADLNVSQPMFDLTMAAPHNSYVANDVVVHNSGKILETLLAATLIDAKKVLIVPPALPRLGWAEDIAKWLREEAVLLNGRAGKIARKFCLHCMGHGYTPTDRNCPKCKMLNGHSTGFYRVDAGHGTCTKHQHTCPSCRAELHSMIDEARWVIVNYDLCTPQRAKDGSGKAYVREDLPGWIPHLAPYKFDLVIFDEGHLGMRGWPLSGDAAKNSRRARCVALSEPIERAWETTGTPQYSYVRDYAGQLDCISKGAMTDGGDGRKPFSFHVRYCEGGHTGYNETWKADGCSRYATSELPRRMKHIMLKRDRSEILGEMPPKTRQVIRIEGDLSTSMMRRVLRSKGSDSTKTRKILQLTAKVKLPSFIENVIPELLEKMKVMVVAFNPETCDLISKELGKAVKKREIARRMKDARFALWTAHGGVSSDARRSMAAAFSRHSGAAAIVLTISAWEQGGVSIEGVSSQHWFDMHHDPSANLQVEDRAYIPGVTKGMHIMYYTLVGSLDEHREARFLPKIAALADASTEEEADRLRRAFSVRHNGKTVEEEELSETLDRLTAHLFGDVDEESGT